jgi:hypothetical protein
LSSSRSSHQRRKIVLKSHQIINGDTVIRESWQLMPMYGLQGRKLPRETSSAARSSNYQVSLNQDWIFLSYAKYHTSRSHKPCLSTRLERWIQSSCKSAPLVYHSIKHSYRHQIVQIKKVMERTSAADLQSRRCNLYPNYIQGIFWRGKERNPYTGINQRSRDVRGEIHTNWGKCFLVAKRRQNDSPSLRVRFRERGGTDVRRLLPKPSISLSSLCMPREVERFKHGPSLRRGRKRKQKI